MPPTLSALDAAGDAAARVALCWDGGELTYAALAGRVRRAMAHFAPRAAAGGGAPVALVAAPRVETVVALWALWELGLTTLLVHPRLTPAERAELSADGAWIVDEAWSDDGLPEPAGVPAAVASRAADRPLAVVYTSGSTGRPKGVVLSRGAFEASARASEANLGWREGDRWLLSTPIAHVGGLSVLTRCLLARRTVVLAPWAGSDLGAFAETVARHRVTLLSLVPTMLHRLFEVDGGWRLPGHVRAALLGGAPASGALLREAAARGAPVLTTYGMSEACSQVATQRPGTPPGEGQGVGPPLPGVEVRVENEEIWVRGPTMMSGYLRGDDPRLEGGWFPTGDLGALDERGHLHVLGRRSDTIITGGENVSPREVERVLEEHPGVAQACVFGVDDERWGQIVAAALVPSGSGPPDEAALFARVASRLAPHKRPRRVAFVERLPVDASGKIRRREAAVLFASALRPPAERGP
jgi:o-succinylbenzoate---CoA ligase